MAAKHISINGIQFVVQSYLRDDYCNLVSPCQGYSIRIEWDKKSINGYTYSSDSKMDERWQLFVSTINAVDVKNTIDLLFTDQINDPHPV